VGCDNLRSVHDALGTYAHSDPFGYPLDCHTYDKISLDAGSSGLDP
jgi:hypothetical protein